jgi:hypothetical protein
MTANCYLEEVKDPYFATVTPDFEIVKNGNHSTSFDDSAIDSLYRRAYILPLPFFVSG